MTIELQVPGWAVPPRRAVLDCIAISQRRAGHPAADGRLAAVELASGQPSAAAAIDAMNRIIREHPLPERTVRDAAQVDTLAWLIGLLRRPPTELPERHLDGRVVTAEEAYTAARQPCWEPEEHADARQRAQRDAARWRALADIVGE